MKATHTHPQQPIDWVTRCAVARSVLNQREPSEHTARMATAALAGVDADGLIVIDRTMRPDGKRESDVA